jgi:hypothetical protein
MSDESRFVLECCPVCEAIDKAAIRSNTVEFINEHFQLNEKMQVVEMETGAPLDEGGRNPHYSKHGRLISVASIRFALVNDYLPAHVDDDDRAASAALVAQGHAFLTSETDAPLTFDEDGVVVAMCGSTWVRDEEGSVHQTVPCPNRLT